MSYLLSFASFIWLCIRSILTMMNALWSAPYTFWALLSVPAFLIANQALKGTPLSMGIMLHITGELSARFMLIALMITPLRMLFPKQRWTHWLMRRRRALGVASFFYALAHTVLYCIDLETVAKIIADFPKFGIWTGWVAFAIFIPLAVTSNDYFVRRLKKKWKTLQRWTYPAAAFILLHWIFIHGHYIPALVHFTPWIALTLYRLWKIYGGKRRTIPQEHIAS